MTESIIEVLLRLQRLRRWIIKCYKSCQKLSMCDNKTLVNEDGGELISVSLELDSSFEDGK